MKPNHDPEDDERNFDDKGYSEDDEPNDDYDFQPCDNCDLPDACEDFGCAIKAGIRIPLEW